MKFRIERLQGYELDAPEGEWIARPLARGVPYESDLLEVAAALLAGTGVVVDAGAHIGNHSVYLALTGSRVVALEPNPSIRAYLERNCRDNALEDRIRVLPLGLWSASGGGHLQPGMPGNEGTVRVGPGGSDVELTTLDALGVAPDLIKIDVEGAELEVLHGAMATLKAHRPAVIVESHGGPEPIQGILGPLGYRRLGPSLAASPTYLFAARVSHRVRAAPFVARLRLRRVRPWLRTHASRFSLVREIRARLAPLKKDIEVGVRVLGLRMPASVRPQTRSTVAPVLVSLTSFPPRIEHTWIPIETMLRQDSEPEQVVLVLSEEEFPRRELPMSLVRQVRRGLEILWTPADIKSYKKLIPTRLAFPEATIVTIDDDWVYRRTLVSTLTSALDRHPGEIIGFRGWEVGAEAEGLKPYREWLPADESTPTDRTFLTGCGGVIYPPALLPPELLTDADLARNLCPTADDVWFWAVARVAGVQARCLGRDFGMSLRRAARTSPLNQENYWSGENDRQLRRVVEHFGLSITGGDVHED